MGSSKDLALLDTSILMLIASRTLHLDTLLEELVGYRVVVPIQVVEELEKLSKEVSERGRKARWVLDNVVPRFEVLSIRSPRARVDEALLELARSLRAVIVTADLELARKARKLGIKTIVFRRARRGLEEI